MKHQTHIGLKVQVCAIALGVASSVVAADVTWQSDGTSVSGAFTDAAHWNPTTPDGPGSGYPASEAGIGQTAVYPNDLGAYTVTFPSGTVTNVAPVVAKLNTGDSVWWDGTGTTWVQPKGVAYGNWKFYLNGGQYFFNVGPGTPTADVTLKDFGVTYSATEAAGTVLAFNGGTYDFHTFSGTLFGGAFQNESSRERFGKATLKFTNADVQLGTLDSTGKLLQFGFGNSTNRIDVSGGRFLLGEITENAWVSGHENNVKGLFEFDIHDGAAVTSRMFQTGYYIENGRFHTRNKTHRFVVRGGSDWNAKGFYIDSMGRNEFRVTGAGSTLRIRETGSRFGSQPTSTNRFEVLDGATVWSPNPISFGASTDANAVGNETEVVVSNATYYSRTGLGIGKNARLTLLDGARLALYDADPNNRLTGNTGSELVGDGAIVSVAGAVESPISGFAAVKVGPKGLVFATALNGSFTLPLTFSDLKAGTGHLVLRARSGYPLTLAGGASTESYLDIAANKVILASGASHAAYLTVTNNATFSLAGSVTTASVSGLTLGNAVSTGVLELDVGDTLVVTGVVSLVKPQLSFTSALAAGEQTVIRTTVAPTAETVAYWRETGKAMVKTGLESMPYARFVCEKSGNEWLFKIIAMTSLPAKAGDVVWQGPGDAWATGANWAGSSAPDATHGASFAGAAPTMVTLPADAKAASLSFGGADYTLTGGALELDFTDGLGLSVASGAQCIETPVSSYDLDMPVAVAAGASLELSNPFIASSFTKTGSGTLTLGSAVNRISAGFMLSEGTLRVASPTSLDAKPDVRSTVVGGTLSFAGDGVGSTPLLVSGDVAFDADRGVDASIPVSRIAGETAGTVKITKTGSGRTALDIVENVTFINPKANPVVVREGELVLRGQGAQRTVDGIGEALVRVEGAAASCENPVQPTLVVDNCRVPLTNFYPGKGATTAAETWATQPGLVISNGGLVTVSTVFSALSGNTNPNVSMRFRLDGGTIHVSGSECHFNSSSAFVTNTITMVNGARLESSYDNAYSKGRFFCDAYPIVLDCDASTVARNAADAPLDVSLNKDSHDFRGMFRFRNGSKFCCRKVCGNLFQAGNGNTIVWKVPRFDFTFEDSEWFIGDTDWDVPSSNLTVFVRAEGPKGHILAPPATRTWRLYTRLDGPGGFTKRGAGTLVVDCRRQYHEYTDDPITLAMEGAINVEGGTLSCVAGSVSNRVGRMIAFANGAVLDFGGAPLVQPVLLGAGELRNAALGAPVLKMGADDAGRPFGAVICDFAATAGRVMVDCGRTSANPLVLGQSFVAARWTGVKPATNRWRAVNLGDNGLRCVFTANDDGTVTATVAHKTGLTILVR